MREQVMRTVKAQMQWGVSGTVLPVIRVLVMCGVLVAGLAPFHSPRNDVRWLGNQNGLHFGKHGVILSSAPFREHGGSASSFGLEIWLLPKKADDSHTFFALSSRQNPQQFRLRQYHTDLLLESEFRDASGQTRSLSKEVGDVLRTDHLSFLTLTFNDQNTDVYLDRDLVQATPGFHFDGRVFAGTLVLGNSPVGSDGWIGDVRGLALYNSDLTAAQVQRHYQSWSQQGRPEISREDRATAIYLFDEKNGDIVHNQLNPGVDLRIPERYVVPYQYFLKPFWREYRPTWSYWEENVVNIVGFMPVGIAFFLYLSLLRKSKHPALIATILGTMLSLTIEVLQSQLPTRSSGTTDLFTNTLGTYLGVVLSRSKYFQAFLSEVE
jgi:VanZ like family/Concanavalin A-like lectin/glucanases superfamily